MRLILFDGVASVFKEDIFKQNIIVVCVKNDGTEVTVGCEVKITCMPLNAENQRVTQEGVYVIENKTYTDGLVGTTSQKPSQPKKGQIWFDTSTNKPIWWNGANWVRFDGTPI